MIVRWLEWKTRREGTVHQLYAPPPQTGACVFLRIFVKFEVWEHSMSILGGAGTALPGIHWHLNYCCTGWWWSAV